MNRFSNESVHTMNRFIFAVKLFPHSRIWPPATGRRGRVHADRATATDKAKNRVAGDGRHEESKARVQFAIYVAQDYRDLPRLIEPFKHERLQNQRTRIPTGFMENTKPVSLRDVASFANVSTGTVSKVLNNNPSVAPATRAHVEKVIEKLGYVYNRSGAQLRNKRTGIIGVSICNLENPYFAENAVGIERALADLGLALILGHTEESAVKQAQFLTTARQHNVEGLILMPALGTTRRMVEEIVGWGIPLVMVSRHVPCPGADYAGCDNQLAAHLATEHLLQLGHERIAFVGATTRSSTGKDRLRGYKTALQAAGRPASPELVYACEADREKGFYAIRELLLRNDPPTAIVCFNDLLAFGVMLGLRSLGLEAGKDCSVVGIDNVVEAALWQPGLTTVAVDSRGIGQCAGHLLRSRIEAPKRPSQIMLLPPKLVVRDSCSQPRITTPA